MSAKLRPDKGTVAENIAKKYFPCTCGETYLSRKLTAPDCPYHAFDWEEAFEEYAASSPKISGEEGQAQGVLACGKSTVDGSYVKGIYRNESGANYIDSIPVHPWSIGVFFEKPTHPEGEQGFAWQDLPDKEKDAYYDKARSLLTDDLYFCTRVWSAWSYGTMTEDDFKHAYNEDDFIEQIASALYAERRPLPDLPANHDAGLDAKEAVGFNEKDELTKSYMKDLGWNKNKKNEH